MNIVALRNQENLIAELKSLFEAPLQRSCSLSQPHRGSSVLYYIEKSKRTLKQTRVEHLYFLTVFFCEWTNTIRLVDQLASFFCLKVSISTITFEKVSWNCSGLLFPCQCGIQQPSGVFLFCFMLFFPCQSGK